MQQTETGVLISVKVTPKSREEGVMGLENEILKVRIQAPPEKGEANRALIRLLAQYFGLPQRDILILKGGTARLKTILLEGYTLDRFLKTIQTNI